MPFDGLTYARDVDSGRLKSQLSKVIAILKCGDWFTLRQLEDITGGSQTGLSARIRDLSKVKFKVEGYSTESRRVANSGKWEYRMVRDNIVQKEMF